MSVTWSYSTLKGWPPLLTFQLHGLVLQSPDRLASSYEHVSYMVLQFPDRLASSYEHVSYMALQSPARMASSTNMSVTWSYSPLIGWPPLLTCQLHGLTVP